MKGKQIKYTYIYIFLVVVNIFMFYYHQRGKYFVTFLGCKTVCQSAGFCDPEYPNSKSALTTL